MRDIAKYRLYMREYNRKNKQKINNQRKERRKKYIDDLLYGKRCERCESVLDLVFHHIDPSTKKYNITRCPKGELEEELKKCIVLCRSCHTSLHKNKHGTPEERREYYLQYMKQWHLDHPGR